jgi:hypothetical protein
MKCLLGKLRTRVSVFSDGGMLGGQAIDTLVETWAGMEANWGIDTRESEGHASPEHGNIYTGCNGLGFTSAGWGSE